MKRLSSLRNTRSPIPSLAMASSFPDVLVYCAMPTSCLHAGGTGLDRFDDVVIAGAAADIALELMPDRRLVEPLAEPSHDIDGGHDHARRAEAALQPVILVESLLHGMEFAVAGEPLDGGD